MTKPVSVFKRTLATFLCVAIANPFPAFAQTDISTQPLAQPAANVKPNIMLIFDDSGSMRQQYTPDYLGRYFGGSNPLCFDAKDTSSLPGDISGGLDNCEVGDVPMMSPDINTQYYNPEIQYIPAVNYDGTSKNSMTAANTTNWTAVPTDSVSSSSVTVFKKTSLDMNSGESSVTTVDLVSGYPDRLWCYSQSDTQGSLFTAAEQAADPARITVAMIGTAKCRTNSSYSYPDDTFGYGLNSGGTWSVSNMKTKLGAPYYYRLEATEHCSDVNLTTCTASTVPTGAFIYPAKVRYCTGGTTTTSTAGQTFSNCQAKYKESGTTYTYPRFLGTVNPAGTGSNGAVAVGSVTISTQNDSAQGNLTGIIVNGVNISGALTLTGGQTREQWATAIVRAINGLVTAPQYHAHCAGFTPVGSTTGTCTGNVISLRYGPATTAAPAPNNTGSPSINTGTPGATPNGFAVSVSTNVTGNTAATQVATISGTSSGDSITSYAVSGTALIPSGFSCPSGSTCGSLGSSARNSYMATQLAATINANTSAGLNHGYSAVASGANVTVTAPASLGSSVNGVTPSEGSPGMTVDRTAFSGGVTTGDIDHSTANLAGGVDVVSATLASRTNVGTFSRVDIVPFQDPPTNSIASTFVKYPSRDDCVTTSGVCTYAEEMTNFANWYTYYRSRSQMAKTAIGRAFVGISDAFRVGFITINPSSTTLGSRFLAVGDFASTAGGQKDLWYQRLYGTTDNGSTPLREALSRVGRYYAGVTGGINYTGMGSSPIQVACQPNYAILVTDGYWNGNQGVDLSGSAVGNQDNVDSGYSKRSEARYDGALASSTNTLADVAMYYYKTDLRTDLSDQVPVTSKDPASHQHMTTFTVGMGLAGQLTFDSGYENGTSADFEKLKIAPGSGGLDWPVPAANEETTLDDLWHAAVNGRGTFFSAKDPAELANSISETLSSVQARVGAGAAAATSNLQPVAGDNFAFTAEYETVTWIGDLKARTIDLSTGTVASRQLWSAADLLNARDHTTRKVFTYDSTDLPFLTPPSAGNSNGVKSFCYPAAMNTAGYPTCTDGSGLADPAEMDYFLPQASSPAPGNEAKLVQSTPWASDSSGRDVSATRESLVDYLRGATLNEESGGSIPTASDLYRARSSRLGDIINAQPAYVKASPFSYNSGSSAGTDPYYTEFKNTTNGTTGTRKGTVYVAANDGMLHAFETDPDNSPYFQTGGIGTTVTTDDTFTGTLSTDPVAGEGAERWSYIPGLVVPYIKRLADSPYSHRYYTDGTPIVGDVCFGHTSATPCSAQSNWRTMLVAGLNAGGRGYYALDVSDPDNPKALWEIKGGTGATCLTSVQASSGTFREDCNIGYTFGNPLIVKRKSDGKWVVIFASGHNNVSPGDGKGYLYVVDAKEGFILQRLTTGVGCDGVSTTSPCVAGTVDPSGLSKINGWVDNAAFDNTVLSVYGGDLQGNVWRFEFDGTLNTTIAAGSVTRIAALVDPSGAAQPVTVKPELGKVNGSERALFIGTGKFLGDTDKTSIQRQSFYAIRDAMECTNSACSTAATPTNPVISMARSGSYPSQTISGFTRQTLEASAVNPLTERTTAANTDVPFQSPTQNGWFIDFPDGGVSGSPSERVNVDPILQLGTLVVPSNVPNSDTCVAGGYGWINFLDYKTGTYIVGSTNNMVSQKISSSLVVGINVVQLPGGTVKTIVTTADNQQLTEATPVGATAVTGRRVSWRELFFE
jgi:type IV pilus assembly protein PilY1